MGFPDSSSIWLSWLKARFSSRLGSVSAPMSLDPHGCFGSLTLGNTTKGMNPYGFASRRSSSGPRHSSKVSAVQCSVTRFSTVAGERGRAAVARGVPPAAYCEATASMREASSGARQTKMPCTSGAETRTCPSSTSHVTL